MYRYPRREFIPMLFVGTALAMTKGASLGFAQSSLPAHRYAYHKDPPNGPLPATLDPAQFTDNKAAFVAYSMAQRVPSVLYQLPCYCHCDRRLDHTSLLDCYVGRHGIGCKGCQVAVVFAYEQYRNGKTATEIRSAMDKLDFLTMDLDARIADHYAEFTSSHRTKEE